MPPGETFERREGEPGDCELAIKAELEGILVIHEHEARPDTEARWFSGLADLVDRSGAHTVANEAGALLELSVDQRVGPIFEQIFGEVCQSHVLAHEGLLYQARLMVMPVAMRGAKPADFPLELHPSIAGAIQLALTAELNSRIPGASALAIPVAHILLLNEYLRYPPADIHHVLATVNKKSREHAAETRGRMVSLPARPHDLGVEGDLVNLSIGVGRHEQAVQSMSAGMSMVSMPSGSWLAVRALPVVVILPVAKRSRFGREYPGLGEAGSRIADLVRYASTIDCTELSVSVLGLFSSDQAVLRARMLLSQEDLMTDMLRILPSLDVRHATVRLTYVRGESMLALEVDDRGMVGAARVRLPMGVESQAQTERIANECRLLGLRVVVDHGDDLARHCEMADSLVH